MFVLEEVDEERYSYSHKNLHRLYYNTRCVQKRWMRGYPILGSVRDEPESRHFLTFGYLQLQVPEIVVESGRNSESYKYDAFFHFTTRSKAEVSRQQRQRLGLFGHCEMLGARGIYFKNGSCIRMFNRAVNTYSPEG